MKKVKQFRVSLFPHETEIAKTLILLAARHNAGTLDTSIERLKEMGEQFKDEGMEIVFEGMEIVFEVIGKTQLCVDVKYNGQWQPSAVIEEVEVFKPVFEEEEETTPNVN